MTSLRQNQIQQRETDWLGFSLLLVLVCGAIFGTDARSHSVFSASSRALVVFGLAAFATLNKFNHLGRNRPLVLYCADVGAALCATLLFSDVGGGDALNTSLALLSFAAAYATARSLCDTCSTRLLWGIAALASVLGAYGLAAHQRPELYFAEKIYNHNAVTATFINPNHLATLLGFGSVAALVFYAKKLLIDVTRDTGPASIAALGILATGLSHSLFDNTLSIPAVGMTFAAGLGLARSVGAPA
jgi:hypothetical protein